MIDDFPKALLQKLNLLNLHPLTSFQFAVQIDDLLPGSEFTLGFNQIIGFSDQNEIREVREGGYRRIHRFPRRSTNQEITLVRGLSYSRFFWNWYQQCNTWKKTDPDYTKNISLYSLQRASIEGQVIPFEVWQWELKNAWPSSWTGPRYDALAEELAFQSITIQHSGLSEVKGVFSGVVGDIASVLQ